MNYAQLQAVIQETDASYAAGDAAAKQDAVARRQEAVAQYRSRGGGQTAADPNLAYQQQKDREERLRRQKQVMDTVKQAFMEYGLNSLYGEIEKYAKQDLNDAAIYLKLRETQAYKDRFPAMQALSSKGRGITEREYISFERDATRLERTYGLPEGMLGKEAVTTLLTNEVDAAELQERVVMAANATQTVPQAMRSQFTEFYGVGQGGLTAYFLDPEKAKPLLERQYAAATIAGQGEMQGVDTSRQIAEDLYEQGVNQEQARQGFGQVAKDRALTTGKNQTVTQDQLIRGTFGNENYARLVDRARNAETGQYAGGGSFVSTNTGVTGLGKSST